VGPARQAAHPQQAERDGDPGLPTVHPSSLLRIEDDKERKAAIRIFVAEMRKVADMLG
jgi:hypothetical protein